MKKAFLLLICVSSSLYAEPRELAPVIERSINSEVSSHGGALSSNVMYEVMGRVEQLQREVQQLRGLVEEQSQTIVDLKKRQGNIYSDLDLRIQELSGVDINASSRVGLQGMTVTNISTQLEQQTPKKTSSVPVQSIDKNQKKLYQAAYEVLRNGHNTKAIAAFNSFLEKHPKSEYADNCQYWLGEAYKVNQDLESAKLAFSKVVSHYPDSPKVADALLKLGYIASEKGNSVEARDFLTKVTVSYPGTTAAHLASKKLIQMGVMQP